MTNRRVRTVVVAGIAAAMVSMAAQPSAFAGDDDDQATHMDFDRHNFSESTEIDNPWTPLVPGTQAIFEGTANRGPGELPHRVVYTATDLTKVIDGVESIVMYDVDINEGVVAEAELAFEAQDDDGNVWNMGEYPEEYENGVLIGAPNTWIPGRDGAKAGLLMREEPRLDTSSYRQGLSRKIGFGDVASVFAMNRSTCVIYGCFDGVLVTDESNTFDPDDAHQRKFYARGVGNIRIAPTKGDPEQETLELVAVRRLDRTEMAQARAAALELDRRAYTVAGRVYGHTAPAQRAVTHDDDDD